MESSDIADILETAVRFMLGLSMLEQFFSGSFGTPEVGVTSVGSAES